MPLQIVDLAHHQAADTIEVLQALLTLAQRGQIRGLAFSAKLGPGDHHTGTTGDYWRDPCETMAVASILNYRANQALASRRQEPATDHAPLQDDAINYPPPPQ